MPLARCSWLLLAVCCWVSPVWAEDADESPAAKESAKADVAADKAAQEAAEEADEDVQELIRQLDADDFTDRSAAGEALAKKGKDAIGALEAAIGGESLEVRMRALELLRQMFKAGNNETKAAARAAFERLAKGNDSAARQAKQILEPPPAEPSPSDGTGQIIIGAGGRMLPLGGAIRIRAGGFAPAIRIAPVAAAAIRRSVSVSNNNGVKTVEADDNGKKFKVVDDPAKGIEGEMTVTKDGKDTIEKFAAKNADELKTKHPEAHKLYEQYAKGDAGAVRVEIGGVFGLGGAAEEAKPNKARLQEQVKKIEDQIERAKQDDSPAEIKASRLKALTRRLEQYQESLKELQKEAEKKEEK